MKDRFVPPIVIPFHSRGIRSLPSAILPTGITSIPTLPLPSYRGILVTMGVRRLAAVG